MMRLLIFLLALLASCGPDYQVREHTKTTETLDGYSCVSSFNGAAVKLCPTREECNEYCDKMNKEDK